MNEMNLHVHQLGRSCARCGYVAVPARYCMEGLKEVPYEEALRRYGADYPEIAAKWVRVRVTETVTEEGGVTEVMSPVTDFVTGIRTEKICDGCGDGFEGYGRNCGKCRMAKSRERRESSGT